MAGRGLAVRMFLFYFACWVSSLNHYITQANGINCYCSPCDEHLNETCHVGPNGKCFTLIHEEEDGQQYWTFGCVTQEEGGTPLMCMANSVPTQYPRAIECCDDDDFCNDYLEPPIHLAKTLPPPITHDNLTLWQIFGLSAGVALTVFSVTFFFIWCKIRQKGRCAKFIKNKEDCLAFDTESHIINEVAGASSGSGSGQRILIQRTIGRELDLKHVIGKGRYGEVWKAIYHGQEVAVKIMPTTQDATFSNEIEIYKNLQSHDNILRYIMPDIVSRDSGTQMLLVVGYHGNGSLHEYLGRRDLDLSNLLNMAVSIACGLEHLHSEIAGIPSCSKPPIAHRDLKSRNILVKDDLSCCICDFGLAACKKSYNPQTLNIRQGTVRYMSPEVLNGRIDRSRFESLLKADIYSVSLVFWEMARRCNISGPVEEYQIPYYEYVNNDPSFEEMREVVCVQRVRPRPDPRWHQVLMMKSFLRVISECWHMMPDDRTCSLRVLKTLIKLRESIKEDEEEEDVPLVRVK